MSSLVEMHQISKLYPNGVLANDRVDFSVEQGEIHALVGENGAGKSTLMKILAGAHQRDAGKILIDGQPVEIPDPITSQRLGISMIHQEFNLVPSISVASPYVGSTGTQPF